MPPVGSPGTEKGGIGIGVGAHPASPEIEFDIEIVKELLCRATLTGLELVPEKVELENCA